MTMKSQILARIDSIKDENTLREIHEWLEAFLASESDTFEPDEINSVMEGYQAYKAGKTLSHEEASERFEKWLGEKGK
ncbi:MAG: hypothetical protein JJU28_19380 [Cyclobacteriaceae bacterium]|nr:hypothetical protein [Cyclobacteriaceae bacterium]